MIKPKKGIPPRLPHTHTQPRPIRNRTAGRLKIMSTVDDVQRHVPPKNVFLGKVEYLQLQLLLLLLLLLLRVRPPASVPQRFVLRRLPP